MFDARKFDRFCATIIRWFLIGCLGLVGVLLLIISLNPGEPAPRPYPLLALLVRLLFFAAGIGWFAGIVKLVRYLRHRRNIAHNCRL